MRKIMIKKIENIETLLFQQPFPYTVEKEKKYNKVEETSKIDHNKKNTRQDLKKSFNTSTGEFPSMLEEEIKKLK